MGQRVRQECERLERIPIQLRIFSSLTPSHCHQSQLNLAKKKRHCMQSPTKKFRKFQT